MFRAPAIRGATSGDWAQLARFCLVGGSGWVVNLAAFTVLLAVGAHYAMAAVGAFAVAWCNNFILNRFFTFRRPGSFAVQGARHLAVSLAALAANLALLHGLVLLGAPVVGAQALAIFLIAPCAFIANRRWAFR